MRLPASRLAQVRAERGFTQGDFARLLGVSRSALSNVENGHVRAWPKLRRAASQLLAVPEEDLFGAAPLQRMEKCDPG
jgi:transcriptional regulator with XRE-family HTH domain